MAFKVVCFAALISLASCQSSDGPAAEKEFALLGSGADIHKRCAAATKVAAVYGDEDTNPKKIMEWHEMERTLCGAAEDESLREELLR